eukprot:TRINITY_DN10204_c0_g1_i1.p1 TRINITY_DN10204_c0_g1~~TRINITY_DN10204_c0_g1_i1.p1  ORF type:complete len:597 (+),score=115.76 TRINITY_DN10204_c0_g1_i1:168-1958(+)
MKTLLCLLLLAAFVNAGWRSGFGITCLNDELYDRGIWYFGALNTTRSGLTCQAWSEQLPHKHDFSHLAGNRCRNPGGVKAAPWCYTTDHAVEWEYCDVCNTLPAHVTTTTTEEVPMTAETDMQGDHGDASGDISPTTEPYETTTATTATMSLPTTVTTKRLPQLGEIRFFTHQVSMAAQGRLAVLDVDFILVAPVQGLSGVTVELRNVKDGAAETLASRMQSGYNVHYDADKALLSVQGQATGFDYELVLRNIIYSNSAQQPTEGEREVVVTCFAGGSAPFASSITLLIDADKSNAVKTTLATTTTTTTTTTTITTTTTSNKLQSLGHLLSHSSRHILFAHLLFLSDMYDQVVRDQMLLIAPTDDAFPELNSVFVSMLRSDTTARNAFLQQYMVKEADSIPTHLSTNIALRNIRGQWLSFATINTSLTVQAVPIVATTQASNGQFFAINHLLPTSEPVATTPTRAPVTTTQRSFATKQLLTSHPRLSNMVFFMQQADLFDALDAYPVLLSPVNEAFSRLSHDDLLGLIAGRADTAARLHYHMLASTWDALPASIATSNNKTMTVSDHMGQLRFDSARVLDKTTDGRATVYFIDRVL